MGLVIKRLLAPGPISELAMRCCVVWKRHFTPVFHWDQAVYSLWWPSLTKNLQTKAKKCPALVWLDRRKVPGSYERTKSKNFIVLAQNVLKNEAKIVFIKKLRKEQ